jgi:hypothetical protein
MIDIIAVTYGQNEILKCFINSIKAQTNNNWILHIIHDGPNSGLKNDLSTNGYIIDNKIIFHEYPERVNDYGHTLRKWGVKNLIKNDYVLLTNCDNYYTPNMVDEVLKTDADFIYFDMVHSHPTPNNENNSDYGYMKTQLKRGFIDIGSAVMKKELVISVGFEHTDYHADWLFFKNILNRQPKTAKINKVLFVHN